jgi:alkylation response protein AidB-like acyl-CoA dehydrogenase
MGSRHAALAPAPPVRQSARSKEARMQAVLETARKLVPMIRAAADEIEAARELPRPLFEALADAGMFHLAVPRAIGGAEIDLPTYVQVIEELGKADASTGWIVNQGAIFATYAARMPRDVARAIWTDTPRSVVANTPAPSARAVVVPGGYRVTGRQGFSTGCRHAAWIAPHAQIVESGEPRLERGQPETRYLFVPVAEAELLDTWTVRGMRGTGTHHFAVHDVFVPAERTVLSATAPLREPGPLYRIPRTLCFASGDAAVALGMARTGLETFFELAGSKTPRAMPSLLRDQSMVQVHVGQAEAALRSGRAFLMETVRELWATVAAGGAPTLDQRATLRLATTHGIRLAAQVIDTVYNAAGVTAAYDGHPLQRHFQDIHVITQHLQGRLAHYELVGRHWLGLPVDEARL